MGATAISIPYGEAPTDDRHEERQLVARATEGDANAFSVLYQRHVGRIYALCLRLTADEGVAEDCAQEAFVSAWRHLRNFAGDSRFGTWLHRIAVNEALGVQRKAKRRSSHLRLVEPAADHEQPLSGDPLDRVAATSWSRRGSG